jgi:hypothetical protein
MRTTLTIAIVAVSLLLFSTCKSTDHRTIEEKIKPEKLMDAVDHGLHRVVIDDTTTILIYIGTESCTMIQLK